MLKKLKLGPHLSVIFKEMCSRVNANIDHIDLLKDEWAEEYEWTIPEEIKFQQWLFDYLVTNKEALIEISTYTTNESVSTTDIYTLTREFTLFYGWALKDESDLDNIIENEPKTN